MPVRYIKNFESSFRTDRNDTMVLLWGDPVQDLGADVGTRRKVRIRGVPGTIDASELTDTSLLELYIIDVGQGDSVLFRTPDDKWHIVDGGTRNSRQMTRKGAANFVRWKFQDDLRLPGVSLENVIISHSDLDHFGGLIDLLSGRLVDGRTFPIAVNNLYHGGVGRFRDAPELGASVAGEVPPLPITGHGVRRKGKFITELLDGKATFAANAARPFADNFAALAPLINTVPVNVKRLSMADGFLPGYGAGNASNVTIRVLAPILENFAPGGSGLRVMTGPAITTNGHSVVLRLDYGQARILLTGDLNSESQKLLLSYQPATEFAVDVAKACHHGAEEVYFTFIKAIQARATVISSGDNEDYSHPRPILMGASGRYGREPFDTDGRLMPPLIYSTELARSVKLAFAASARADVRGVTNNPRNIPVDDIDVKADGQEQRFSGLERLPLATDLIYGLVNVRTDGTHILCATLEEKGGDFDYKVFKAGV